MLTALPDAANDLTLPCHEQRAGAATGYVMYVIYVNGRRLLDAPGFLNVTSERAYVFEIKSHSTGADERVVVKGLFQKKTIALIMLP